MKQQSYTKMAVPLARKALTVAGALVIAGLASSPAFAGGLDGAKTTLQSILTDIKVIVPILATIGLIGAGVAFAFHWVQTKYIVNFAIGCVIVGVAGAFVPMLMGGA